MMSLSKQLMGAADAKQNRRHWTALRAFAVGAMLTAVGFYATHSVQSEERAGVTPAVNLSRAAPTVPMPSFADLVDTVRGSVVSVRVRTEAGNGLPPDIGPNTFEGTPFERFFRDQQGDTTEAPRQVLQGQASGFLISADGYIVTNNHVVDKATKVEVVLDEDTVVEAKVVGTDPRTDLALLKIEHGSNLPHVTLADTLPRVGEWVVVMGNPFGLGGSVTAGIVSARGRDIGTGSLDSYIQIDAPVNRGNSGGPTFNMSGQVIGVNTAIYSPSGGSVGIAFDIPATTVKTVAAQLKEHGRVERGWLGVNIRPISRDIANRLGLADTNGALVGGVQQGSPAANAGLATGDVIASVDGAVIKDARDLARTIGDKKPGSTIKLTVTRKGKTETRSVTLETLKQ